ncbi:GNAT family N-acetyltransferase [Thermodesulfobacteriota bacterium]
MQKKPKISIKTGKNGLKEIQSDWNKLVDLLSPKRFFHYFEWYESYIDALEKNLESFFFILIKNDTDVEGIIPLIKRKEGFFNILELPHHAHLPLRDIIYPDCNQTKESIENLIEYLASLKGFNWDFIRFSCLLPDSCGLKFFEKYSGTKFVRKINTCDYIPIQPYEKIEANLSRNMRNQLKRARKKAKAIGKLHNESFQTLSELSKAFQILLDLESSGWKGMAGTKTAIICNEKLLNFYNLLLKGFSIFEASRIDILFVDTLPIAGQLGFVIGDTCYQLKIGYNEEMSHISPGNLHIELLLKKFAQDQKLKYFNLVSGANQKWHKKWKPSSYDTYEVIVFNRTFKGYLALAYFKTKEFLKPYYHAYIKKYRLS